MKTLYIDCSMGCAGDMLTAALLELHPDPAVFLAGMNAALGGRAVVSAAPDAKCGIRGTHVTVTIHGQQEGADSPHAEHTHGGASAAEIMAFLDAVPLSRSIRENAKAVYARLLDAESVVHGCAVEQVHFHEVGALAVRSPRKAAAHPASARAAGIVPLRAGGHPAAAGIPLAGTAAAAKICRPRPAARSVSAPRAALSPWCCWPSSCWACWSGHGRWG